MMAVAWLLTAMTATAAPPEFRFQPEDRIVLVGNALIERDAAHGWLETELTARNPGLRLTFRNLGWSGDTVGGEARAGFDPPERGFERLIEQVEAAKPTVLIIGYGNVEAFAGPAGLPGFTAGLDRLLDRLAPLKARTILLSPIPVVRFATDADELAPVNAAIKPYSEAIRAAAEARGARFLDVFTPLGRAGGNLRETGMHLNEAGYRAWSDAICADLLGGVAPDPVDEGRREKLRAAIRRKNELFFFRWRPQNETYLFGFRKYEQGRNAIEVPQFDPLVEEAERGITELAAPPSGRIEGRKGA